MRLALLGFLLLAACASSDYDEEPLEGTFLEYDIRSPIAFDRLVITLDHGNVDDQPVFAEPTTSYHYSHVDVITEYYNEIEIYAYSNHERPEMALLALGTIVPRYTSAGGD